MAARHRLKTLLVSLAVATLPGCQLAAEAGAIPARLVAADKQLDIHPLTALISKILNGAKITLADDAFYNSSEVIIEGPQLGRTFEKPHHFRLWLRNSECLLEHVESGEKRRVETVACQALSS